MLLNKKWAIVTGSNRGIGKAIVEKFARNGANVYACARCKNLDFEKQLHEWAIDYNVKIIPIYFDLTDDKEIKLAVNEIRSNKNTIDILINNAGKAHGGLVSMTKIETMKDIFDVNFYGPMAFTQQIVRLMMKNKSGNIINISSVTGLKGNRGTIAYGSSKAALIYSTQVLAKELGAYNIRVNSIAPGYINTDMFEENDGAIIDEVLERTSLKKIGDPSEVADVAVFLASAMSSYVTGEIIRVDGGL